MTVVIMGQISLDNWVEKSEKKSDQDLVDGMSSDVVEGDGKGEEGRGGGKRKRTIERSPQLQICHYTMDRE